MSLFRKEKSSYNFIKVTQCPPSHVRLIPFNSEETVDLSPYCWETSNPTIFVPENHNDTAQTGTEQSRNALISKLSQVALANSKDIMDKKVVFPFSEVDNPHQQMPNQSTNEQSDH